MLCLLLVVILLLPKASHAQQNELRIINGHDADQAWPWMVSLTLAYSRPALGHFCGAALIEANYILTAAHCASDIVDDPDTAAAVIGRRNLTGNDGEIIPIVGTIIHPDFNPYTLENDFAVLRLAWPSTAHPVSLLSPAEETVLLPAKDARILGWGVVNTLLQQRTSILQEASIPTIHPNRCLDDLGSDFRADSMLCAGVLSSAPLRVDGVDTCTGDSGGPLIVNTGTAWKVAGITSWGRGCASSSTWGVYARVAPFVDWITRSRIVAPIGERAPRISGTPRIGNSIQCSGERFGGDPAERYLVRFRETKSGRTLSNKRAYRLRSGDRGRKIRCTVTAVNSGGRSSLTSGAVSVASAVRRRRP